MRNCLTLLVVCSLPALLLADEPVDSIFRDIAKAKKETRSLRVQVTKSVTNSTFDSAGLKPDVYQVCSRFCATRRARSTRATRSRSVFETVKGKRRPRKFELC